MTRTPLHTLWLLTLLAASPTTRPVSTKLLTLHDPTRNRDLPLKIYYPTNAKPTPSGVGLPVIIFSHGLGGSREGYSYLGKAFASHNFISIHPSHPGTDTDSLLKSGNPLAAATLAVADPTNAINRPLDISFLIDQLPTLNKEDPDLKNLLDTNHIGVAGHSFGAHTVLALIGQSFPTPRGSRSFLDTRISAAIAMSSPVPARKTDLATAYAAIKVPCLHMTGTLDELPFSNSKAPDRRIPFDHTTHPDTYLITFTGADHMTFSGHIHRRLPTTNGNTIPLTTLPGTSADPATDALFHPLITQASLTFFTAHLNQDPTAHRALTTTLLALLSPHATFEHKSKE